MFGKPISRTPVYPACEIEFCYGIPQTFTVLLGDKGRFLGEQNSYMSNLLHSVIFMKFQICIAIFNCQFLKPGARVKDDLVYNNCHKLSPAPGVSKIICAITMGS